MVNELSPEKVRLLIDLSSNGFNGFTSRIILSKMNAMNKLLSVWCTSCGRQVSDVCVGTFADFSRPLVMQSF